MPITTAASQLPNGSANVARNAAEGVKDRSLRYFRAQARGWTWSTSNRAQS